MWIKGEHGLNNFIIKKNIKVILFDSGRVLNAPKTGHWFIPPRFFKYVDPHIYRSISAKKRYEAFQLAEQYIKEQHLIESVEQEYVCFTTFYRILADHLPELHLDRSAIENVAHDLVYNPDKYVFFPDVKEAVEILCKKYRLGIISDAWPSLENVFEHAGLRDSFSAFVISSKLGVFKPNEKMYRAALNELQVSPADSIFIDDNPKNCIGAAQLGITPILLKRNRFGFLFSKMRFGNQFDVISNLKCLIK